MESTYSLEILQAVAITVQGLVASYPEPNGSEQITTYLSGSESGDAEGCEVVFEYRMDRWQWELVSIEKSSFSPAQRAEMKKALIASLERESKFLPPIPPLPLPE